MSDAGRVVIAGGTGFVGRALEAAIEERGGDVVVLTRSPRRPNELAWDGRSAGAWASALDGAAAVVNLAGRSVNGRWTEANRREILDSRVNSVNALAEAIARCARPPRAWVQAGGKDIYGDTGDAVLDETAPAGRGFLQDVCVAWERAFEAAEAPGTRKTFLRIGVVLGRGGGPLAVLAGLTRAFLGSAIGSGRQYLSWIHMRDLVEMCAWGIDRDDVRGTYNATAPNPATNAAFMRALRHALRRPPAPRVPAFAARLGTAVLGTEASLLLEGNRVVPRRFLDQGFAFRFPDLDGALEDLVGGRRL